MKLFNKEERKQIFYKKMCKVTGIQDRYDSLMVNPRSDFEGKVENVCFSLKTP